MEFIIGIVGDGFVLTAGDCTQGRSVIVMKHNMDKMVTLGSNLLMPVVGPVGDTVNFGEYIQKNIKLQEMRQGFKQSTWTAANFIRSELAGFLRSRTPYHVDLLVCGCDETDGPQLYMMDYLASMVKAPFAAHGYGAMFTLSVLDRHYKPNMTLEEAKDVLRKCINEVQKRLLVQMPLFKVRMVNTTGIHDIAL